MTQNEFEDVLANHSHYLAKDLSDWENRRANLAGQDLTNLNITGNLKDSILKGTNLSGLDLSKTNINNSEVRQANLNETNFNGNTIVGANFTGSEMKETNFKNAILKKCTLTACKLDDVNLLGATLEDCTIEGVDLKNVNLKNVKNFINIDIVGCSNIPANDIPSLVPEKGSFYGYKILKSCKTGKTLIAQLEIPADAIRVNGSTNDCRVNKAKLIKLTNTDDFTESNETEAYAPFYTNFI